jgi:hypothetical protein
LTNLGSLGSWVVIKERVVLLITFLLQLVHPFACGSGGLPVIRNSDF